jgi:hypothetical protein
VSRRSNGTAVLAAGAAAALLAGCQSNPAPPPLDAAPSPTASSPSPSPSATPPAMPAEATGTSRAAAKAFVRHYIDMVNYAMATGDTGPLVQSSAEDCESCSAVAENISSLYRSGGRLEGKGWRVADLMILQKSSQDDAVVQVGVSVRPQKRFSGEPDATPERFKGGRQAMTFFLTRVSSGWSVRRWSQTT